jgi:hypothetical protein
MYSVELPLILGLQPRRNKPSSLTGYNYCMAFPDYILPFVSDIVYMNCRAQISSEVCNQDHGHPEDYKYNEPETINL